MQDRLARLGDEQAIRDVLARYWRGIDRQDPELVLGTYHPGAYDDHGYYKGPVEGFVESLAPGVWAYFANTQHFAGNIQVELVAPDRARVESYAEAHHIQRSGAGRQHLSEPTRSSGPDPDSDRDLVYGLRYVDDFERRGGEWRIARRICAWDWHRVDAVGGIPLPASYFRGHHSKDDPVYAHPRPHGRRVGRAELVAKQACLDTLMRYTRGVDRCDSELVRSAYHADAYDDHGGYQGDVDGFLAWVKPTVMDTFSCTMHKLGNVLIEIEGNRAFAETYAIAHHVAEQGGPAAGGATDLVMGVRYLDRLEDRGAGWKIAHRQMSFEWERTLEVGSQREYPGFARGRRDGSDPVLRSSRSQVAVPVDYAAVEDRAAIYRQLVRYCRGVDRRDLELVRSTYHPDAYDDHGTYKGDVEGFLAFVKNEVHARFRTTMHKLGQSLIEIEGDVARAESYAICHHVMAERAAEAPSEMAPGGSSGAIAPDSTRDGADMVMGIRYVDRFERREGEWRIAQRELRWEWIRTDRLEPLDPGWTPGRSDAGDPVFLG
jgi:SnoaL-like domain